MIGLFLRALLQKQPVRYYPCTGMDGKAKAGRYFAEYPWQAGPAGDFSKSFCKKRFVLLVKLLFGNR